MDSRVGKIPWRRGRLPTSVFLGFPGGLDRKESACSTGDLGSIPGLGGSPGRGHGNPLQCSCLKNPRGQRRLEGHRAVSELDMTERLILLHFIFRFVIAFLPRSNCLLISWLQSPSTMIWEPGKMKSVTAPSFYPSICHA